jgi:hypothetical protein
MFMLCLLTSLLMVYVICNLCDVRFRQPEHEDHLLESSSVHGRATAICVLCKHMLETGKPLILLRMYERGSVQLTGTSDDD